MPFLFTALMCQLYSLMRLLILLASILPVSHMIHGVYEIDDVVLSMPVIVGADGIESDIPINLSGEEALKLKESADALKNIIDTLEL